MSEETPLGPDPEPPAVVQPAPPVSAAAQESLAETGGATGEPQAESYPFWTYGDLFFFFSLAIPCMLLGWAVVKGVFTLFHIHPAARAAAPIAQQFAGYLFWFGALWLILKIAHNQPFWRSLAWKSYRMNSSLVILLGVLCAYGVALLGKAIQTPETPNAMTELMEERGSLILMAIFGITLGPLCEELAFRGLLQPLLVRSMGAALGIIVAAIPFGLLHYREYGNSWRHAAIVAAAGAGFGWVRHVTGSTRASTIMHGAYNALFFVALLAQKR
jgi:uncharacterized protein